MNGNSWNCHSHDICNHYTVIDSQSSQLERLFSLKGTARSLEDETRNGQRNANGNPEWGKDFHRANLNLDLNLYHEI